eukprot:gene20968-27823_t
MDFLRTIDQFATQISNTEHKITDIREARKKIIQQLDSAREAVSRAGDEAQGAKDHLSSVVAERKLLEQASTGLKQRNNGMRQEISKELATAETLKEESKKRKDEFLVECSALEKTTIETVAQLDAERIARADGCDQ